MNEKVKKNDQSCYEGEEAVNEHGRVAGRGHLIEEVAAACSSNTNGRIGDMMWQNDAFTSKSLWFQ